MTARPAGIYFDVVRIDLAWLVAVAIAAVVCAPRGWWKTAPARVRRAVVVLSLLLLMLPPIAGAGTNTYLFVSMIYGLAAWFGLVVLVLRLLSAATSTRLVAPALAAGLCVLSASQIVEGAMQAPYRLNTGLRGQVVPTAIGAPASTLDLDPETSAFFTMLHKLATANGFRPGDDVLAFFDMPGVVFALGGRSPGLQWYTAGYRGSPKVTEDALATVGQSRIARAFLLQTPDSDGWLRALTRLGIRFPDGYALCGELRAPRSWFNQPVRLWRPLDRLRERPR